MLGVYTGLVPFDDLTAAQLAADRQAVTRSALYAARLAATRRLIASLPGDLGEPEAVQSVLVDRDATDHRHELLSSFEKAWSLLVIRIVATTVSKPTEAVADARLRGATVPQIATALGITPQGVYSTYGDQVRRAASRTDT